MLTFPTAEMSQESTQDLTHALPIEHVESVLHDLQEVEDNSECIATLWFKDMIGGDREVLTIYPGEAIIVGRVSRLHPPKVSEKVKEFAIYDGRVSKRHFRIYSIIYEEKSNHNSQSDALPPLIYCEDLESSNGTYINGELIGIIGTEKTAHLLCDGDVIEIRPNWHFTFHQSNHQIMSPTTEQSKDLEHFVDRYVVSDRLLGSGQFGSVYLAKELPTNKQIACKIIDLEAAMLSVAQNRPDPPDTIALWKSDGDKSRNYRKKVLQEIDILSRLSHPNIINIQKAFYSHHALYIFTDLAPAGDLYSYAQSHGGHLDDYDARVVTKQITFALEYLHSQDIAHRDIKQENILVTSTDFGGRVILTDFGFATNAKITNGRMGRMLSKVGTLGCVAPEVEYVDRTSLGYTKTADLWSLGILTASLLTGALDIPQFEHYSQFKIADRFLGVEDSYAKEQWIQMPPRALKFIRMLLVVNPEDRMTASEALQHTWYTMPVREALALDDGLRRINRFWEKRKIPSDEVLEALPGVVLSMPTVPEPLGPKLRKKIPDATSSPYFGLDRHLNQKALNGRKRLLDDLNESGSPFFTSQESQSPKRNANSKAQKMKTLTRAILAEGRDVFNMSPSKEPSRNQEDVDLNNMDSFSTVDPSDASPDEADFNSMNLTPRTEKSINPGIKTAIRQPECATKTLASNDALAGKRCGPSDADSRTTTATSEESVRYTSAQEFREKVGRM